MEASHSIKLCFSYDEKSASFGVCQVGEKYRRDRLKEGGVFERGEIRWRNFLKMVKLIALYLTYFRMSFCLSPRLPEGLANIDQYILAIVGVAAVVNQERRVAPANRDLEAFFLKWKKGRGRRK